MGFPSVASQEKHHDDLLAAANWLGDRLTEAGMHNSIVHPAVGYPIVTASGESPQTSRRWRCTVTSTMVFVGLDVSLALALALFGSFVSVFIPVIGTYIGGAVPTILTLAVGDGPPP